MLDATAIADRLGSLMGNAELLLWSGRPPRGLLLRTMDFFLIPFSLFWCGFALFWESTVFAMHAPFFFKLWGLPFVAVGLYFVVGRFFVDAWIRGRTLYAVTNERVIIARAVLG